jgi:hypothetical protein
VIAAVVVLWLFRSLSDASRAAYQSFLPSGHGRKLKPGSAQLSHLNPNISNPSRPWGWGRSGHAPVVPAADGRHVTASTKQVPWGWPGSSGLKQANADLISAGLGRSPAASSVTNLVYWHDSNVSKELKNREVSAWPYRDEALAATPSFKQRRRKTASRSTSSGDKGKPWGW